MVSDSTFSSNSAFGGGILAEGVTTITNCTFSGNTGTEVYNSNGTMTVTSTTFNSGTGGSLGACCNGASTTFGNSILQTVGGSHIVSAGYNLVANAGGFTSATGDQTGVIPPLDALGNYGGPTQTMMPTLPLATNPAIAVIPPASCTVTTDQRGQSRPSSLNANGYCDVGAVERQSGDSAYP